jgi:hypothetical protein
MTPFDKNVWQFRAWLAFLTVLYLGIFFWSSQQ